MLHRMRHSSVGAVKEPLPMVINRKPTAPTARFGTLRNIQEELLDPNGPRFSTSASQLNNPAPQSNGNSVCTVGRAKFVQDVLDVRFHRLYRDE